MDSARPMECDVCNESFNEEERRPLFLPCSHSFCMLCVSGLLRSNNRSCPICRKSFEADSCEDLPINRGLYDAIQYIRLIQSSTKKCDLSLQRWQESHKQSLANVQKTNEEVKRLIHIDEKMIDEVQELDKVIKSIAKHNEEFIKELEEHKEKLQNHLEDAKKKEKEMTESRAKLSKAETFTTAGPVMDVLSNVMKSLEGNISDIKLVIDSNKTVLDNRKKNQSKFQRKISSMQEMLISTETLDEIENIVSVPGAESMAEDKDGFMFLSLEEFREETEEVYAVKSVNGEKRYSLITRSYDGTGERLWIPSFKENQSIPSNAKFIKFEYIRESIKPLAYLDLSYRGNPFGRFIIRYVNECYFKENIANHQFLCSGELGPSFVNTSVLNVMGMGTSAEYVVFGDYENDNGSGGKPVCGSDWYENQWDTSSLPLGKFSICQHGTTKATASQFRIMTSGLLSCKFGQVIEGIDSLKTAIQKCDNIRDLKISDCGLIFDD